MTEITEVRDRNPLTLGFVWGMLYRGWIAPVQIFSGLNSKSFAAGGSLIGADQRSREDCRLGNGRNSNYAVPCRMESVFKFPPDKAHAVPEPNATDQHHLPDFLPLSTMKV